MQCLNQFSISASLYLTNPPNPQTRNPSFQAMRRRTHKIHESPCDEGVREIASKKAFSLPPHVKTITSTSIPFVKHCVKLRQSSSYRHLHGMAIVVGTTPVREIYTFQKLESDRPIVECLFVVDNCCIPDEMDNIAVRVVQVNSEVIRKISGIQSVDSVEVIALMRIPSTFRIVNDNEDCQTLFPSPHRILVLDGIQDPGNLGTLVRSATAFRWDGVFLLPGCCDPFNDKAVRACRGACFQIPIASGNWEHVGALRNEFEMKMLAGHPATGDDDMKPVVKLSKDFAESVAGSPLCLVLGSEGAGLSPYSRRACELVAIAMAGEFESLNVSVAGGIFMYMLQHHSNNKPA